jgi:BASS family bile acid:Na+ symporter
MVTVGLLLLINPHPSVAAGFVIIAFCPGAPFGPPLTAMAKGDVAAAVGLMVLLAGSSATIAPLALHTLLPFMSGDNGLNVDAARIAGTLLMTQLSPFCAGIAVRHWTPALADKLQDPGRLVSKLLNLTVVGLILLLHDLFAAIRAVGFAGMIGLLSVSWVSGWLLGGPALDIRKAMAVTTSRRNFGVGLVIAAGTFPGTPAITAIAFGIVSLLGTLGLATFAAHRSRYCSATLFTR